MHAGNTVATDAHAGCPLGNRADANSCFEHNRSNSDPSGEYPVRLHRESGEQPLASERRSADGGAYSGQRGQSTPKSTSASAGGAHGYDGESNVENHLEFGRGDPHHSTRQDFLTNTDPADADVNAYRDPATGGADATNDNRRISRVR